MGTWVWEEVDVDRSGSSGDVSKLFKNEGVKRPGVLGLDAPPADATLLAREAIQNSWDAGRALAKMLRDDGQDPPRFSMRFVFRHLVGDDKRRIVAASGLDELAERASRCDRRQLGLADRDCLQELDQPEEPLSVLLVEESATTGMDGPWKGALSKLYLALVSIGFTVKLEGAGGSYGYGKAGLIRTSSTRTVLAHTCFRERSDDPGVTRRLLGMTYWGQHSFADAAFTGFARMGRTVDGKVVPFENDEADQVAGQLGIRLRDPVVLDDLGSTFLLIDPIVRPEDLRRAIERNWWPAIVADEIDVELETADGEVQHPRPKRDDVLMTFIRGYELATQPQDNRPDNEFKRQLKPYQPRQSRQYQLGSLGLVADLERWSYASSSSGSDDDEGIDHQSLVALVRGPRMVVEYLPVSGGQPYVRGTFVAHEDIDDLLRQTEPKAHDAWLPKQEEEGIDPDAPKVAGQVIKRIRQHVREFRRQLNPPSPRDQDIRLPLLDDLFRGILENRGPRQPPPPPPDPRPIAIRMEQRAEMAGPGQIRMRASVHFALTDRYEGDEADCRLVLRYVFDEDGSIGDNCPLSVTERAPGFQVVSQDDKGTTLMGVLTHDATTFEVVSQPYHADWSGQLIVLGEVLEPVTAGAGAGGRGPAGDE